MYLTDEKRLYRLLEVVDRSVMLEDCSKPEGTPVLLGVGEIVDGFRLVRPEA